MGSGCSPTDSTSLGSTTPGSARSTRGDAPSSPGAGPESPSSTTSEQLALTLPSESMSSPAASPARAPAPPASATASSIPRPFCGARWPAPFASFDPATSSWRTWRTSLPSTTEPSGERFSETWPRSGTTSRGTAYQQQPSAPRTSVTGSSPLLPTPRMRDGLRLSPRFSSPGWGPYLEQAVLALLPTPSATDYGSNQSPSPGAAVRRSLQGVLRLLPTPNAYDGDRGADYARMSRPASGGDDLLTGLRRQAEGLATSRGDRTSPRSDDGKQRSDAPRLSPWFVEWMLGVPSGWTDPDCPLSATEFRSRSANSPGSTSSSSNAGGSESQHDAA